MAEVIKYGAHTATIESNGTELVIDGNVRVPIDTATTDPGGSVAKSVPSSTASIAYALLALAKQRKYGYGKRISFVHEGRQLIALYQQHPPDGGMPNSHPGITLLEPAGERPTAPAPTPSADPSPIAHESSEGSSPAAWWGLASVVSSLFGAYHGYKRNESAAWAFGWGVLGALFPVITPAVAVAQGFGKPKAPQLVGYAIDLAPSAGGIGARYDFERALRQAGLRVTGGGTALQSGAMDVSVEAPKGAGTEVKIRELAARAGLVVRGLQSFEPWKELK